MINSFNHSQPRSMKKYEGNSHQLFAFRPKATK